MISRMNVVQRQVSSIQAINKFVNNISGKK